MVDQLALESPQTVTKPRLNIGVACLSINESMMGVAEQREVCVWLKVNNKFTRRDKMD